MATTNSRPRVTVGGMAQRYAMRGERIIEVSSDGGGCLVSLRVIDGRLRIEVYRADDTVDVVAPRFAPRSRKRDADDLWMMNGGREQ